LTKASEERRKLEEIRAEAYKSAKSYREGTSYFMINIFFRNSLSQK